MDFVKSRMSTSTTTLTCTNELSNQKTPTDSNSAEVDLTMLRAQQSSGVFICQTAPQSPSKLTPVTSPVTSPNSSWKPGLARSGSPERVKSSLKLRPGLKRANSEPSQKSVHFSTTNLVDIRPFKRGQRPSAVSQKPRFYNPPSDDGESSGDIDEEDEEENCDTEEDEEDSYYRVTRHHIPTRDNKAEDSSRWVLLTPGFVPRSYSRLPGSQRPMCYADTLQLSTSRLSLNATVYVRNIAFQKYVALRYSLNDWGTFTEVQGTFSSDVRKFDRDNGYDRFDVKIPLNRFDAAELNGSTLKFCVHYVANGQEFWDNNGGKNFEVYLRNSKLKSYTRSVNNILRPLTVQPGQALISNGQLDDQLVEESNIRRRADSEPDMARRYRGGNAFSDDDVDDYGDILSGGGPSQRAWHGSGITFRESLGEQNRDPFVHRYSFESAFAAPPKSSSRVAPNIADLTLSGKVSPLSLYEPHPVKVADASKTSLAVEHDAGAKHAPAHLNSWESDSYKELVSKYCFYTPQYATQPITPSRNASSPENSSSEELIDHSIGPHPRPTAAHARKATV